MELRYSPLGHKEGKISGYAIKWHTPSDIPGIGPEEFTPGSLKVSESGCSLYFQHDRRHLLANTKSGTLKLIPDSTGLKYEATLPKSATGILEACEREDIQGVSVGFLCTDEDRSFNKRVIKSALLHELSLVDKPSHKTSLKLRSKQRRHKWTDLILEFPDV